MLSDIDGVDLGMDSLPAKRKSLKPMRHTDALGGDPAAAGRSPPRAVFASVGPQPRGACGPACSSPALGAWSVQDSAASAAGEEEGDSRRSGELQRGKVQRRKVCAPAAAAAAAPGACDATRDAAAGLQGGPFAAAASDATPAGRSLPPSMYRSYHLGCCSRLSSSSSLTEVEAAAAAAAAQAAQAAGLAAPPPAAAATREHRGQLACSCGACAPAWAPLVSRGLSERGLPLCPHPQRQHAGEAAAAEASLWADMPDDILKRVLERLAPSMLRVLRLVCRSWEAAASRQLRHLRPEALAGTDLARRFPGLHSLDLSNAAAGVDFASPRMLRLQSRLRDEHLAELAGLSRLEQLSLRGCSRLTGLGLAQLAPLGRSLTMLNLSGCSAITDQCLAVLAVAVPRLATLNLQGCCRVGDAGVATLASLPALRHVLLPAGITDAALAALAAMPALERVALRGCPRVTTAGIHALLRRRGLKRVVISKCPQVTLEGLCGETHLHVVAGAGLPAPAAPAPALAVAAVAPGGAAAAAAALAGQDMQLLIADMH